MTERAALRLLVDTQFTSPYAMSVFVALHEKGLPFEMATVDLDAGEQHGAAFAALSLTRRVPTLVERDAGGEFALTESSAITEYLDQRWPAVAPLYPEAPRARARARQLQAWLRSDLLPIRQERSTEVLFYGPKPQALSAAAQAAAAKLYAAAEALLPPGAEHLFGHWSIADIDLAVMLNRLVLNGDAVPAPLAAYARRQWLRPSVQRWVGLERPPL